MKKLRALSHGELFLQEPNISICSELSNAANIPILTQAFEDVANQHPLLSAIINTDSESQVCFYQSYWKGEIEEIRLDQQQTLEDFLNGVVNYKLDTAKSLLKIWYLTNSTNQYLVTCISHAVCDGVCSSEFLLRGLERYEKVMNGEALEALTFKAVPDSIEAQMPSGEKSIKEYTSQLKEHVTSHPYRYLQISDDSPGQIKHTFHCLSEQETISVLISCKTSELTFNNLFVGAALLSVHSLINEMQSQEDSHYLYRTPVDLRSRIKPPIDSDCFMTAPSSILAHAHIDKNINLVRLAKQISDATTTELDNAANRNLHQAQKVLVRNMFLPQALHLSNIGRIRTQKDLNHTRPQNMFIMTGNIPFKTISVNTCTFNNRITLDMFYAENYYSPDLMNQFFEKLIANLTSIVQMPSNEVTSQ